jgi:hypothetical protein
VRKSIHIIAKKPWACPSLLVRAPAPRLSVCLGVQRCSVLRCHVRIGYWLSFFSALEKGLQLAQPLLDTGNTLARH